ncbi:MAG: hypothetical protein JNL70_15485 [Saprospiraceae bacterium]|nr:hypothetical protein [Saprospiraceae bacterium]
MNHTQNFISRIRNLIAQDDFTTAIQQLSAFLKNSASLRAKRSNLLRGKRKNPMSVCARLLTDCFASLAMTDTIFTEGVSFLYLLQSPFRMNRLRIG